MTLYFEVGSASSFRDFPKRSFWDFEVGGNSGGMNAMYNRQEAADDVISGRDLGT